MTVEVNPDTTRNQNTNISSNALIKWINHKLHNADRAQSIAKQTSTRVSAYQTDNAYSVVAIKL